jgi:hypothetical protein
MRPLEQIQRAHDQLVGILLDLPVQLEPAVLEQAHAAADVLCWVLEHDHNKSFEAKLKHLESVCRQQGFFLVKGRS